MPRIERVLRDQKCPMRGDVVSLILYPPDAGLVARQVLKSWLAGTNGRGGTLQLADGRSIQFDATESAKLQKADAAFDLGAAEMSFLPLPFGT